MTLIKTSILNAIAVSIKIITLLIINKILAVYIGPQGYAIIGQFQNAIQIITRFGSGAITAGVTKYTAEYYEETDMQHTLWRSAGTISLTATIIISILLLLFNENLAVIILKEAKYKIVITIFAITLIFFVVNTLLLAILNGKKEIKKYVLANIFGSLFSFFITSVLSVYFGILGALTSLATYQSLSFLVTYKIISKSDWFEIKLLFGGIDIGIAKKLGKYSLMAITSALCVPITHILIRDFLGSELGWNYAGYWEAMWRLSGAYLMLVTMTLSVYYLPKLSELKLYKDIKAEIMYGYKIILPIAAICSLTIYLLKDLIIQVLFTEEFIPMQELFAWQLIGDTLKIGGWILAYVMLGKALTKIYITTEIIFSVSFYCLTIILVESRGFEGVALSYAINYFLYWIVMWFVIFYFLKRISVTSNE